MFDVEIIKTKTKLFVHDVI